METGKQQISLVVKVRVELVELAIDLVAEQELAREAVEQASQVAEIDLAVAELGIVPAAEQVTVPAAAELATVREAVELERDPAAAELARVLVAAEPARVRVEAVLEPDLLHAQVEEALKTKSVTAVLHRGLPLLAAAEDLAAVAAETTREPVVTEAAAAWAVAVTAAAAAAGIAVEVAADAEAVE